MRCQSSGSPDNGAMIPAFGINGVPKQTEPELDDSETERTVASFDSEADGEVAAEEEESSSEED